MTSLNSVAFAPTGEGWATGGTEDDNHPYILAYRDGAWHDETPAGAEAHLHSASANAADDVWLAGGGGMVWWYNGERWTDFAIPGGCLHKLTFVRDDLAWTGPAHAGEGAGMRRWSGGHRQTGWESLGGIADHQGILDIQFSEETDGWAVGRSTPRSAWCRTMGSPGGLSPMRTLRIRPVPA